MDRIPDSSEGNHAVLRTTKLRANQSHCHGRRNAMASMIRRTLRMRIGFGAAIIPRLANDGLCCEGYLLARLRDNWQTGNYSGPEVGIWASGNSPPAWVPIWETPEVPEL